MIRLAPITMQDAKLYIAKHHRHNKPPVSGLFAVSVKDAEGQIHGVAIAGRPVARAFDDGVTAEITRVGTDGVRNGCSMLYGSLLRAARALGYRRVYTYTLASESGSSLMAAGFVRDAELPARPTWDCPARTRVQTDLFGEPTRPPDAKVRWKWVAA